MLLLKPYTGSIPKLISFLRTEAQNLHNKIEGLLYFDALLFDWRCFYDQLDSAQH